MAERRIAPIVRRAVGPLMLLAAIVAVIVLYPVLRPVLKGGDRCHPEGLPTVKNVALTVCVDPSTWTWLDTHQATRQLYMEGPRKILFDSIASTGTVAMGELRALVIAYVDRYATNGEPVTILGEGDATLGGRPWRFIEFSSDTGYFVDYYYSAEGFGMAQLFFFSFKEHLEVRKALAQPILDSVTFTEAAGTGGQG
jgi:hypothetical protein